MVLAVVKSGTVLRAIAREDRWIEVLVPPKDGGKGQHRVRARRARRAHRGHAGHSGAPAPDRRVDGRPIGRRQSRLTHARSPYSRPRSACAGSASVSYTLFQAKDSFDAIFGSAWQPFYGGGAQVVIHDRLFVEGSFEQFKKTGQRVVVSDGEVFPLGIEDRVTINPITVSAGYRFRSSERRSCRMPAAAWGRIASARRRSSRTRRRTSTSGTPATTRSAAWSSAVSKWVFTAFEVQYTSVPDALGGPGVAEEFGETNLGGMSLRREGAGGTIGAADTAPVTAAGQSDAVRRPRRQLVLLLVPLQRAAQTLPRTARSARSPGAPAPS